MQDYVNGARSVRELYEMARDTNGKFTVRGPFSLRSAFGGYGVMLWSNLR